MKRFATSFESGTVRLRPLAHADLRDTLAWRNREGVRQQFKTPDVLEWVQHEAWFAKYLLKHDDMVFVVERADNGARVGQVAIYAIDDTAHRAEIGRFVVAPEHAGQGLMRAALEALIALARERLNIGEVYLEVLDTNTRARALYDGLGFVETAHAGRLVTMTRSTAPA